MKELLHRDIWEVEIYPSPQENKTSELKSSFGLWKCIIGGGESPLR